MDEPEWITPKQFQAAAGVDDWRALMLGASTLFRTGSFAAGVALVGEIGRVADDAGHQPDVDLRAGSVTVRVRSYNDAGFLGLTAADIALAQQISAAARELGLDADPSVVQDIQVAVDSLVGFAVLPFWRAVLGYQQIGDEDLVDPRWRSSPIWFQEMSEPRTGRNRIHVDVFVPHDQAEGRVAAALAAGGRIVFDRFAPDWWTLADAEGNEVDVATSVYRD